MQYVLLKNFITNIDNYIQNALENQIFVYPTDTIYGIGAIANAENIERIYELKQRDRTKSLSLISPNLQWIENNFIVPSDFEKILNENLGKFHGITLLLRRKDPKFLSGISSNEKIGVRIIKHPFQSFVEKLGEPFITTSMNLSGQPHIIEISQVPAIISSKVDVIVDGGILNGRPSVLIDLDKGEKIER